MAGNTQSGFNGNSLSSLSRDRGDVEAIARLRQDIEELKRGQEEILSILKGQVQLQNDNPLDPPLLRGTSEISEFREMVRCGADPHAAFKDIQRRKKGKVRVVNPP